MIALDQRRTPVGQFTLRSIGQLIERFGGDQLQHGIAQELQPLIMAVARTLMQSRAMGESLVQQILIFKPHAGKLLEG